MVASALPMWWYLRNNVLFQMHELKELLWPGFWRYRWCKSSYSKVVTLVLLHLCSRKLQDGTIFFFFFLEVAATKLCWGNKIPWSCPSASPKSLSDIRSLHISITAHSCTVLKCVPIYKGFSVLAVPQVRGTGINWRQNSHWAFYKRQFSFP